jgi:hypothetical protein
VSTHLAAATEDEIDPPPRRSLALPILLVLVVLAVIAGIVLFVRPRASRATSSMRGSSRCRLMRCVPTTRR